MSAAATFAAPSSTTCAVCAARQLASARSARTDIETQTDEPTNANASVGRRLWGYVKEVLIVVVCALALSFLIKTFLFQSFWIPSGSMEPTLQYGDRILVTKWRPDPLPLRRGDIVVFKDPGGWLNETPEQPTGLKLVGKEILVFTGLLPEDAGEHLVKRVIGLGGDRVECDDPDGKVKVNGEEITEDYIAPGARPCGQTFAIDVPEGYLWVMGDNRDNSEDSRGHQGLPGGGAMPRDNVVGTAFALVWPLDRFTGLGNPWGEDAVSEDDLAAAS